MKVLIVGKNSYIAQRTGTWFAKKPVPAEVEFISVRDDSWRQKNLTGFDAVIYTAAIVHRRDAVPEEIYDAVNAQQPFAFAQTAKAAGVKQFVFLSTMGVYGQDKRLPAGNIVDENTPLKPFPGYGSSKLKGERLLQSLQDESFHVSIIRPANVYGRGCKGGYISGFAKITAKLPVLPRAFEGSRQGMLFVDNLAELCWLAVNADCSGVYPAQDRTPVSAYDIMRAMADCVCPRKKAIRGEAALKLVQGNALVNKLFGGVSYAEDYAKCPLGDYQLVEFRDAIKEWFE